MTNDPNIVGFHVYGSLYGIKKELIGNELKLKEIILKAVEVANMTLIDIHTWSGGGDKGGVSVIALINESHICLHTWCEPQFYYVTLDIFTCGTGAKTIDAWNYIIKELNPKNIEKHIADRSQKVYISGKI